MARYLLIVFTFLLAGCFGGGEKITDFSDRSTVYGWVDVSSVSGNHLYAVTMRKYSPRSDKPYYGMGIKKFQGGYLFWQHGFDRGAYEFDKMSLQSCLAIICSNTINEYQFGPFSDGPGKTVIRAPGVQFVGNFKLTRERRPGFFGRAGEFSVDRVRGGPSRAAMLKEILETGPDGHPVIDQRIRAAMR